MNDNTRDQKVQKAIDSVVMARQDLEDLLAGANLSQKRRDRLNAAINDLDCVQESIEFVFMRD